MTASPTALTVQAAQRGEIPAEPSGRWSSGDRGEGSGRARQLEFAEQSTREESAAENLISREGSPLVLKRVPTDENMK